MATPLALRRSPTRTITTATHYDTLGARNTASAAELRKAYLAQARKLHPDQVTTRPQAERAKAERAMQEVNAAWSVLSDPIERRKYDLKISRPAAQATGPITRTGPAGYSEPARPKPRPKVATAEEMEIRGLARIVSPFVIGGILLVVIVGAIIVALVGGGDSDPDRLRPVQARPQPTGTPVGCADLSPVAIEVPCGNHEAVVWSVATAAEGCPDDLQPYYRAGIGGLFCVTSVE